MKLTNLLKKGFVSILILIVALGMFFLLGLNQSFDFKGGNILTVNITAKTNISQEHATNKINNVINSQEFDGVVLCSITSSTDNADTILIVKYQTNINPEITNEQILDEIYTNFNYDQSSLTEKTYVNLTENVGGVYTNAVFYNALIGALVAVLACAIYAFARLGLASAFILIGTAILDIATMLAFIVIFNIPVSAFTGFAILATAIISIIFNYMMLSALIEKANDENNKKLPNKDIAVLTIKATQKNNFVFIVSTMVAVLLLAIITTGPANGAMLSVFFGIIAIIISSQFINPSLWTISYIRKTKVRKMKTEEAVETE